MTATEAPGRVLVAGIGNIFASDDGFGVEAVRRLGEHPLPDHVELSDTGVRGVHLAYQLLDGYDTVLLLDATRRGGPPGSVYLIEPEADPQPGLVIDGHRMTPDAVLALLDNLSASTDGTKPRRMLVVGCEPACLDDGIGLSAPVAAAVDKAVRRVLDLLRETPAAATDRGEER
jgi:hydrogenase maturation protease